MAHVHGSRAGTVTALVAVAALAAFGRGCGDSDGEVHGGDVPDGTVSDTEHDVPNGDCIGPEGATFEVDDPNSSADGVLVTVPPGSRDGCWMMSVNSSIYFRYPNGFQAYGDGAAAFFIGRFGDTPANVEIELSLPIDGLGTLVPMQVIAAFWEEPDDHWHVVMPDEIAGDRMIVRTTMKSSSYFERWSWGKVKLDVVDYDEALAPAVEDSYGKSEWAAIVAELERIRASHAGGLDYSCSSLDLLRDSFQGLKDQMEVGLVSFQNSLDGACGTCDVTSDAFFGEVLEYFRLKAVAWFWEQFFLNTDGVAQVVAMIRVMSAWDQLSEVSCDWECFFGRAYDSYNSDLATFWLSWAIVDLAEWGKDRLGCP